MGKNSRERHKAKQKATQAQQRRMSSSAPADSDPLGIFCAPSIPSQRQIAEEIISDAIQARHREHGSELKRCRTLLTDGPGGNTGVLVVNHALLTVLLRDVKQSWERGWQPAELVRLTRRDTPPAMAG